MLLSIIKDMRLVFISDVHCKYKKLVIPECDLLISCGDYSFLGQRHEVRDFHKWLNKQSAKHIISVQGNHEKGVEKDFNLMKQIALEACPKVCFIDEGFLEIEGLKIWGSAITPEFHNWAWNRQRGDEIKKHWDKIPEDIDVLITHGPPQDIGDGVPSMVFGHKYIEHVGCWDLLQAVKRIKPKIHAFGHIHAGYGDHGVIDGTRFINASICDELYSPINLPIVVELDKK